MTDERTFDRLARAWLDLMPDEAPDRAVEAVLQAIETTPQVRPPWRWLPGRLSNMNRTLIAAAVSGAVVLAVGGGLWLTRSDGPPVGGPSPTPSPSASPSASAPPATVPEELQYQWLGEVADAPGLPAGRDRAILVIGPSAIVMAHNPFPLLQSDVPSTEGNALRLVAR